MKEAYRILPVYSGDVSGIASALYELGGMVVIHDPSGCNSTYNTHDETRWYDRESYIFISGLNMKDAILGNDRKFTDDIAEAFCQLDPHPRFIAICNSPVPFLNGTDFQAICRILKQRCKVPVFYVPSNGMHDYVHGASLAFLEYAKHMLPAPAADGGRPEGSGQSIADTAARFRRPGTGEDRRIRVSILGATPLTYGNRDAIPHLCRILEKSGFAVQSVWAMDSSPEELARSADSDVNLVISDTGIQTAEYLQERYGIPYVAGVPVSLKSWKDISDALRMLAGSIEPFHIDNYRYDNTSTELSGNCSSEHTLAELYGENSGGENPGQSPEKGVVRVYIGEAVLSMSLAASCREKAVVLCPFAESADILGEGGEVFDGEEELTDRLAEIRKRYQGAGIEVFADPMYRTVLPDDVKLHCLPTLALSGRMYQEEFPDYFSWEEEFTWL